MASTFIASLITQIMVVLVLLVALATCVNCQESTNRTYGECLPEKATCRDCYLELVRAVLGRDDNVFNLSRIFMPPTFDQPSFVTVNYRFYNDCNSGSDCVDEVHTWFWAKSGAYLLHPLVTFEFISLLFGNAQPLYEEEVYVTLDASECYGVDSDHMTLLTQRLKIYIQEHSFFPQMDSAYIPVAANSITTATLLGISHYTSTTLSADSILFFCPLAATLLALIIMAIILILYVCGGICKLKSKVKTTLKKQDKATTVALSIVSCVRILIFIALDSAAVHFIYSCSDQRVEGLCKFSKLIHNTPIALLVCDILAFLVFIIIAVIIPILAIYCIRKQWVPSKITGPIPVTVRRRYSDPQPAIAGPGVVQFLPESHDRYKNQPTQLQYYCYALSVICFIFSCLVHTPYVVMAYLSDAHYATSILIYYTTILFIEFGVIQYTITFYFDSESLIYQNKPRTVIIVFVLLFLLYFLVLSASFFYYYIPMINVVTNLPNEGVVVYQTAIVLVGAYVTYRTLIKVEKSQQNNNPQLENALLRLKEAEIALIESKIDCQCDPHTLESLNKKRVHLRKEIMLECIQGSISALENEPENPINQLKIDHLRNQAEEVKGDIRFYLHEEIRRLKAQNHDQYLNEKISHLQNEIQSLYGVEPKLTINHCCNCSCKKLFSASPRNHQNNYQCVGNAMEMTTSNC